MKKIRLHPKLKHQLVNEFNVSMQTVSMSLANVFNSDKAKSIRKRAKELLQAEADKIKEE